MGWLTLVFLVVSLQVSFSFIFPLKKPDGSVDFDSLLNHVRLLEQTIAKIQQDWTLQKTEISDLKAKVGLLQSQFGTGHLTAEVNSLKDELFATRTELGSVSNEVISVNSGLKTMTSKYSTLQIRINDTKKVVEDLKNTTDVVRSLQHETSKLQAEVNATRITLKDQQLAQNAVVQALNITTKATSVLKTDVALLKNNVLTLVQHAQATSQDISRMSPIVDRLNEEVWFEVMNPVTYAKEEIIQFQDIKHNIGGGYDSTSGNFTAPVSGIYLFWTQICLRLGKDDHMHVNLLQNGVYLTYTVDDRVNGTFSTGTVVASVEAKAGDTFCVTSSSTSIAYGRWSTFGGTLLRKH